nr:hypothetical protein [Tissierella sp.]
MAGFIRKHKKLIAFFLLILIILLPIYLKVFFTKGIVYDDVFLVKSETSEGMSFKGKSYWGDIELLVKGDYSKEEEVEVRYKLPNDINKIFTVEFSKTEYSNEYMVNILDQDKTSIFKGAYSYNSELSYLFNEEEDLIFEDFKIYDGDMQDYNSPYNEDYEISPYAIVNLAALGDVEIKGDISLLLMAILILIITAIDIKYPLLFFRWSTFLSVKNAEPSEFYLAMQALSWVLYPIIALGMIIIAILD